MNLFHVPARVHGRVVVRAAPGADLAGRGTRSRLLLVFHGYGQRAETMVTELAGVPGIDAWTIASVQGLHAFYNRSQEVVASWMTKEDRELAIGANVAYVDDVTVALQRDRRADVIVCLGFSQGASMAWRAGVLGRRRADGVVALGGDIPPELKTAPAGDFPIGLVAGGTRDDWYTAAKMDADLALLTEKGAPHGSLRFDGGHEWTDEFRAELGRFLSALAG
ncbi:MAG: phospholipase [Acidobacteriota bacterium]|nr:phospholipase [Acidobacteriota bacterium]